MTSNPPHVGIDTHIGQSRVVIKAHQFGDGIPGAELIDNLVGGYNHQIEIDEIIVTQTITHKYRRPTP